MTLLVVLPVGWALWYLYQRRTWLTIRLLNTRLEQCEYDAASRWLRRLGFLLQPVNRLWYEGLIANNSGQSAAAEQPVRDALTITAATSGLYVLLETVLRTLGRWDEAEDCCQRAIRAGDVSGRSQIDLAQIRLDRGGSVDEALAYSTEALAIASRRVKTEVPRDFYCVRARVLARLDRPDEAASDLEQARGKTPSTRSGQANLAWSMGLALLELGRTSEACNSFQLCVTLDPNGESGRLGREALAAAGVEFRPVVIPKPDRRTWWWDWWPFPKGYLSFAVLIVLVLIGCPIVIRFAPGPQPDFRLSAKVVHFANGQWTPAPKVEGGVSGIVVSPKGVIWTSTPRRDAILRWDGSRWDRFDHAEIGQFILWGEELWALADKGVIRFDGTAWHRYQDVIAPDWGEAIGAGPDGVWVCDQEGTFAHFNGTSWSRTKLETIPNVLEWRHGMDDLSPDMRITPQGAVWMALDTLWRHDASGWRRIEIPENELPQIAGVDGERLWLLTETAVLEAQPSGEVTQRFRRSDLPVPERTFFFRIFARGSQVIIPASKNLLLFDGSRWRDYGVPSRTTILTDVALAADGSAWVVAEDRPLWQVGQWIGPGLAAAAAVLFVISAFMILWAAGAAKSRRELERLLVKVAGGLPDLDNAGRDRALRRRTFALWWQVPLFLVGFPYLVVGVEIAPLYVPRAVVLGTVGVLCLWLVYRWWHARVASPPVFGLHIPIAIGIAVVCYFYHPWLVVAIAVIPALWRLTMRRAEDFAAAGQYEKALRYLQRMKRVWPNAEVMLQEAWTLKGMDRGREAEVACRRALSRSAGSSLRVRLSAIQCLAHTLTDLGRFEDAEHILENLIEIGGEGRFGIADLLLQQAKAPEKALGLIEESQRITGGRTPYPERTGNQAWALALLVRLDEMRACAAKAVNQTNASCKVEAASVYWRVGRAFLVAQQTSEAIEHFRKAVEEDPHGYHGRLAREDLARCSA